MTDNGLWKSLSEIKQGEMFRSYPSNEKPPVLEHCTSQKVMFCFPLSHLERMIWGGGWWKRAWIRIYQYICHYHLYIFTKFHFLGSKRKLSEAGSQQRRVWGRCLKGSSHSPMSQASDPGCTPSPAQQAALDIGRKKAHTHTHTFTGWVCMDTCEYTQEDMHKCMYKK